MKQFLLAMQDVRQAGKQYPAWLQLGVLEVKQRYRRSVLGPWWITISTLIFIIAMSAIFSRLLIQSLKEYVPFFTAGFLLWSLISTSLNEATDIFRSNSGYIKQLKLPYNLYVLKFLVKSLISFAHNFIVYLLVILYFQFNPGWHFLFALPGFALLFFNLYWMCLVTALLSTRFRDLVPIIGSTLQVLFFITPISWMPKMLGEDSFIVRCNPLYYLIESVRQPLLGHSVPVSFWWIEISLTLGGLIAAFWLFSYAKAKIPFWID